MADQFSRFVADIEAFFKAPAGRRLMRPRHGRIVAGVCAGVAEYFDWNVSVLRAVVVVCSVASCGGVALAYAAGWVVIPEGAYALPVERS